MTDPGKLVIIGLIAFSLHFSENKAIANGLTQSQEKGMKAEEYVKKRPKAVRKVKTGPPARKRYYRVIHSGKKLLRPADVRTESADVGFTLWKFGRISDDTDTKSLKEAGPRKSDGGRRMGSETPMSVGDLIRIGIESGTHEGYMYVINREKYLDGSYGVPRLIFPSIRRANNYVRPGVLMYFPSSKTNFEITMDTEKKQVAEELIVIVSPDPLVAPENVTGDQTELSNSQVSDWIQRWSVDTVEIELEGGIGESMSDSEKTQGDEQKSLRLAPTLTQDDPYPQTVYRMNIKRGNPVLATIELKIKP